MVRVYSARDRSFQPCLSQPPPGTWIVVGASGAAESVQDIGPVVAPKGPPPVQTVFVTGVKPQVPSRLTVRVGRGPETPPR